MPQGGIGGSSTRKRASRAGKIPKQLPGKLCLEQEAFLHSCKKPSGSQKRGMETHGKSIGDEPTLCMEKQSASSFIEGKDGEW